MISTLAQTAVSLTQSIEMSLLTKATIILAFGLVAARLAARARASVRHLILSSSCWLPGARTWNARAWAEAARERPNGEWRTPLSMARRGGHAAVVAFLVSAGARD